ncbi:hypothetical protein N7516_005711 [Penicillium verrucosum]|uniref:uncharacterized protein n=1 Tax=Penicillium verrucosum TaxID=60171 RepID=UPI002545484C|nr:uncharacterized protein N7516_005711 [Penicillium verrucosum]KAJ5931222.1 hypothetical protein N7516_005711 [Penicillium verrucosum]
MPSIYGSLMAFGDNALVMGMAESMPTSNPLARLSLIFRRLGLIHRCTVMLPVNTDLCASGSWLFPGARFKKVRYVKKKHEEVEDEKGM